MKTFKNRFGQWEFSTHYIEDVSTAEAVLSGLPKGALFGLDIETAKTCDHPKAGLCPLLSTIRLLQIYTDKNSFVFDLGKFPIGVLNNVLRNSRFVGHNSVFEIQHLTHAGFKDMNVGCSMLLSQLIDGAEYTPYEPDEMEDEDEETGLKRYVQHSHSLDAVVQRLFKLKVDKAMQVSDWGVGELSTEQITYAGLDALLTYEVAVELVKKLKEYKMERAYQLLKDTQHVVAHMQLVGMPVDWKYHEQLIESWKVKNTAALEACKPFFGDTNMRSSKQMETWFLENIPKSYHKDWPKTKKGKYAFSKTALGAYRSIPAINALLEYKKYAKLLDTYGESLAEHKHPVTKRIHTSYTLGQTRTGRMSSRSPNIQNGPRDKEFRNLFCADEGFNLTVSDFAQIETRLQCEFSQDPVMRDAYKNNKDLYKIMASSMYGVPVDKIVKEQRFVGKTCVLALGYGMRAKKLNHYATNAGIIQPQEFWNRACESYDRTFSVYVNWCNRIRERAQKLGYIETMYGKRRKLSEEELYTKAPNTVVQGTAAELIMEAMISCYKQLEPEDQLVASIHDEILIHAKNGSNATNYLTSSMISAMCKMFPNAASHEVADAAAAQRWGDAKSEL